MSERGSGFLAIPRAWLEAVRRGDLTVEQLGLGVLIAGEANYREPTTVQGKDGRAYRVDVAEALVGRRSFAERHHMGKGGRDRVTRAIERGDDLGLWTFDDAKTAPPPEPPSAPGRAPPPAPSPTIVSFKKNAGILFMRVEGAPPPEPPSAPPPAPLPAPIQQRNTEQGNQEPPTASSLRSEACSEPAAPPVAILPCVGKGPKEFLVTEAMVREWEEAYPAVNVQAELLKAVQWCRDSPTKRKTHGGARRFLGSWMAREQNRGPRAEQRNGAGQQRQISSRCTAPAAPPGYFGKETRRVMGEGDLQPVIATGSSLPRRSEVTHTVTEAFGRDLTMAELDAIGDLLSTVGNLEDLGQRAQALMAADPANASVPLLVAKWDELATPAAAAGGIH